MAKQDNRTTREAKMSTTTDDRSFELRLLANLPETSDATVVDERLTTAAVLTEYATFQQYLRQDLIELVGLPDEQNSRLDPVLSQFVPVIASYMVGHPVEPRLLTDLVQALDEQREFGGDPGGVCDRLGLHREAAADHLESAVESLLDRIIR